MKNRFSNVEKQSNEYIPSRLTMTYGHEKRNLKSNLKYGLDDCKWTKETGLERGSYTLEHVYVNTLPHPPLFSQIKPLCRGTGLLHIISNSQVTLSVINLSLFKATLGEVNLATDTNTIKSVSSCENFH